VGPTSKGRGGDRRGGSEGEEGGEGEREKSGALPLFSSVYTPACL